MKSTLIVPAAGESTRYKNLRPKMLLQHPRGITMLEASISGFAKGKSSQIGKILIISRQDYFENVDSVRLENAIQNSVGIPTKIHLLPTPTSSMVETILCGLEFVDQDTPLIIKDCDNDVRISDSSFFTTDNALVYADLTKMPYITASNKSFIKKTDESNVNLIVEKKIISSFINLGLVKFETCSTFITASKTISGTNQHYVSDIVRGAMELGINFQAIEADHFDDWGTIKDWLKYVDDFRTIFIDLDGVLVKNASKFSITSDWSTFDPIVENCEVLLRLFREGKTEIVITTARDDSHRNEISTFLKNIGLTDFKLVTGLPHSKRILINDFAESLPFPTAIGISIPRNSNSLESYL